MNNSFDKWAFYAAFEDRYRGSFEAIKSRVSEYLPHVLNQPASLSDLPVVDLGAGRGEWLTVLQENGIRAIGVDENPVTVERARNASLDVRLGDAFEFLAGLEHSSARGISAFHVIEHLPWELQLQLFVESRRVLAPSGTLLIEWPNIENTIVATQSFWMDPTHLRPFPLQLASFMAEFAGYSKISIMRFRPPSFETEADHGINKKIRTAFRKLTGIDRRRANVATAELRAITTSISAGRDIALICQK